MLPRTPSSGRRKGSLYTPPAPRYGPMDDDYGHRAKRNRSEGTLATDGLGEDDGDTAISTGAGAGLLGAGVGGAGAPLTPAETPAARRKVDTIGSLGTTGRVLFPVATPKKVGSGRTNHRRGESAHRIESPRRDRVIPALAQSPRDEAANSYRNSPRVRISGSSAISSKSSSRIVSLQEAKAKSFVIFDDTTALKKEVDNDNPFDTKPAAELNHPHRPMPQNTRGMWYVFRGKKVFRPFASGDTEIDSIKPRNLFGAKPSSSKGDPFADSTPPLSAEQVQSGGTDEEDTDKEPSDDDSGMAAPVNRRLFTNRMPSRAR